MKKLKTINKILIIIGLLLLIVGGFFTGKNLLKALDIVEYSGDDATTKQVLVKGSLNVKEGACDPLLDIKTESPILIRNVEMVQWYKDENGVRMVLANYPLESFEDNGITYTNPSFPEDLNNVVFYGKTTVGDTGLIVDLKSSYSLFIPDFLYFEIQKCR